MAEYIGLVGTEPAQNVWDANYKAVLHMNDAPGDPTRILDSTSNANHCTKGAGTAAPTEVDGLIGRAQSFDGIDDQINLYVLLGGTVTEEVFISQNDWTSSRQIIGSGSDGRILQSNGLVRWQHSDIGYSSGLSISDSDYHHIAGSVSNNGTDTTRVIYIDDNSVVTVDSDYVVKKHNVIRIGHAGSSYFVDGLVSETRISDTERDGHHVNGTNLSIRDRLVRYDQQGSQRFKMVIPAGTVTGDLANFPVYINVGASAGLSGTDLRALLNNDWWRGLCVRANDGSYCYIENVIWNPVTGYAELHTKLPEILAGSDNNYWLMIERTCLM